MTLASFPTDMGLPVLAQTASSLGVPVGKAALTLSVFLAGFALGPLVCGPLSDHYGRWPVLLVGVAIEVLGVSRRTYGYLFACTALGLTIGALTSARLGARGVKHRRIIAWGMVSITGTAIVLAALAWTGALGVALLVPLAVVGFIGQGAVRPNAVQGALEPLPDIAGIASAVLSGVQMLAGALASAIVASLFDGRSARSMTGTMAVCAAASALLYGALVRRAERRWEKVNRRREAPAAATDVAA